MTRRHPEDSTRYEELLDSTRDSRGVCHRDEAVKLLAEELAGKDERLPEYAAARAYQVADGFDRAHQPDVDNGQMTLDDDSYLVIGDSERVTVKRAMPDHTRQWLDIININKARQDAAHAARTLHGYRLLEVQEAHRCSMWKAEQILREQKS